MKKYIRITFGLALMAWVALSCSDDFPVDEDGLLITGRGQCYVSNFELLGSDFQTVRSKAPVIDTVAQTIDVEVFFGTDLTNVYPQFSLVTDAKLDPKVPGKMDLSDVANPTQWTVISGNRKLRKTYTLNITVQP